MFHEELYTLLLSGVEIGEIMGVGFMTMTGGYHRIPDVGDFSDDVCAGAVMTMLPSSYEGHDYVAVNGKYYSNARPDRVGHHVEQVVVSFASGAAARRLYALAREEWEQCAGETVVYEPPRKPGQKDRWTLHSPTTVRGVTSVVADIEGGEDFNCSHALSAKANVVIDVSACDPSGIGDQAVKIVEAIAANFPT